MKTTTKRATTAGTTQAAPKKRRKPKVARKENQIRIRVTNEQKDAFAAASAKAGLDISNWLRVLGVREIAREEKG